MLTVLRLCALALTTVVAVVAFVGTERLGRPLTDDEKKRFGALLREHDYPGARLLALRFAYKLTHGIGRAQELMGRVDLRLVRFGWDPAEVPLKSCLCRLVWSEWTHGAGGTEKARKAEEVYLRDREAAEGPRRAVDRTAGCRARDGLGRPATRRGAAREAVGAFEAAGDEINLVWLRDALDGETNLQKMAAASGRGVEEFRAAAKRRNRAVLKLLGQARGVDLDDKEPQ